MNRENIEEILKNIGSENVPADVHKLAEETSRDFTKTLMQTRQPKHHVFWEYIMKSKTTKLAAAAVIIVVAFLGISQFFGSTVTFADAIKPILNARTVVLDIIVGEEEKGPVIHDVVVGARIRRTFSNMDTILIIDLYNAKMLTLDPKGKGAVYMDIQGPLQEGTRSYIGLVRNIVADLNRPDLPVQELGQKEIDGQEAVGFFVSDQNTELTVWADIKTALPIRIEVLQGQSFTLLKNIEFDVPVEDSLVSMDVPAGYTLHETELDMSEFTEEDFIESMRLWVELLLDGRFPESISGEVLLEQTPRIAEKIGQSDVSDEEKVQLCMGLGRANVFFQFLDHKGGWHYAGKGVKLGDAEKAVFWYQPKDSENYRVIYGDLHVEELALDKLPK